MKKFQILFYSFLLLSISSCSSNDDEGGSENPALEAETRMNVAYGSNPQQVYDLYLPANRNTSDTKLVFLIHGGGWTGGDKNDMIAFVQYIQANHPDKAIVNVNYVLADETHFAFPNQFNDIQAIVQKLTSEREELQINPTFGMIGTSAGAHLAMMHDSKFDNGNQVVFVADIVGPTDFNDPFYVDNFPIEEHLNQLVDQNAYPAGTDFLTELSPITHVGNMTSPTCMFYGTVDPLVPEENGENMKLKLDQNGIQNDLRIYEGSHGNDWSVEAYTELQTIIDSYITTYLD